MKIEIIERLNKFTVIADQDRTIINDVKPLAADPEDILIRIKGVGRWTIDMFLMFTLQRPDVMPFSDLGVQKGFMKYYRLDKLPDLIFMQEKSKLWSPFRTIAAIYLWHLVDDGFQW